MFSWPIPMITFLWDRTISYSYRVRMRSVILKYNPSNKGGIKRALLQQQEGRKLLYVESGTNSNLL